MADVTPENGSHWDYFLCPSAFFSFLKILKFIFRERGRKEERQGRERNINVWLPLACPLLGTWPPIQARAQTGNWTGDPLVRRPALNPLSHSSQGCLLSLKEVCLLFFESCLCFCSSEPSPTRSHPDVVTQGLSALGRDFYLFRATDASYM